jgi:hypothetical protein
VTLTLSAMVRCNGCGATETVDESNLAALHANDVMATRGWAHDTEGRHFCGWCQGHLPKRRRT